MAGEKESKTFSYQQKTTVFTNETESFKLQSFVNAEEIKGAPIIVGFPNIGITPVLTCTYLVNDLKLPFIGNVRPKFTASNAVVSHSGQPSRSIRIFGDKRLIIVASEFKLKDELINEFSTLIVAFQAHINSEMMWCVEGVPVEKTDKIEREEMQFLTTCSTMASKLQKGGHKVIHDAVIAGVSGGIIAEMVDSGAGGNISVLLAPTSSFYPDAWASVMIIRLLDSLYDTWTSDTSKLEKNASSLEQTVKKLMASNLRRTSNASDSMYM